MFCSFNIFDFTTNQKLKILAQILGITQGRFTESINY